MYTKKIIIIARFSCKTATTDFDGLRSVEYILRIKTEINQKRRTTRFVSDYPYVRDGNRAGLNMSCHPTQYSYLLRGKKKKKPARDVRQVRW